MLETQVNQMAQPIKLSIFQNKESYTIEESSDVNKYIYILIGIKKLLELD